MSFNGMDRLAQAWKYGILDDDHNARLYFFEPFDDRGWLRDDEHRWYRLNCSYRFGDWIEQQDKGSWEAYGGRHRAIYLVRDDLYSFIKLKWL
jgi:hypothetical protein